MAGPSHVLHLLRYRGHDNGTLADRTGPPASGPNSISYRGSIRHGPLTASRSATQAPREPEGTRPLRVTYPRARKHGGHGSGVTEGDRGPPNRGPAESVPAARFGLEGLMAVQISHSRTDCRGPRLGSHPLLRPMADHLRRPCGQNRAKAGTTGSEQSGVPAAANAPNARARPDTGSEFSPLARVAGWADLGLRVTHDTDTMTMTCWEEPWAQPTDILPSAEEFVLLTCCS